MVLTSTWASNCWGRSITWKSGGAVLSLNVLSDELELAEDHLVVLQVSKAHHKHESLKSIQGHTYLHAASRSGCTDYWVKNTLVCLHFLNQSPSSWAPRSQRCSAAAPAKSSRRELPWNIWRWGRCTVSELVNTQQKKTPQKTVKDVCRLCDGRCLDIIPVPLGKRVHYLFGTLFLSSSHCHVGFRE